MFPMASRADDAGYTLLEMLVVLVLLGLTAGAVTLWLPDVSERLVVEDAANLLERQLSTAAAGAARSGRNQTVRVAMKGSSLVLQTDGAPIPLDPKISVKWTAAREAGSDTGQASITFLGMGGASGGTFELTSGRARALVEVDWLTANIRRRK